MRCWGHLRTCLPQSDIRIGVHHLCTLRREGALSMNLEAPRVLCLHSLDDGVLREGRSFVHRGGVL